MFIFISSEAQRSREPEGSAKLNLYQYVSLSGFEDPNTV
ncbi:hypothetical protein SRABI27_02886 [Pedobacter sp. Bi27]|nr:hypothetical protein SRABI27_02886 [Pedobacter sp. Bi27]